MSDLDTGWELRCGDHVFFVYEADKENAWNLVKNQGQDKTYDQSKKIPKEVLDFFDLKRGEFISGKVFRK